VLVVSISLIFKNRDSLSPAYVPKVLPHREKQINFLLNMFGEAIKRRSHMRSLQLIGGVGTGKTATVKRFSEELKRKAGEYGNDLKVVYINLRIEGPSRFLIFSSILNKIAPEISVRGYSPEEMLGIIVSYLIEKEKLALIILDEVDYHIMRRPKDKIVYDLTRLDEIAVHEYSNVIGTIFIARNSKWTEHLDKAELSTLGRVQIKFQPYNAKQLSDILEHRCKLSFREGVVDHEVIDFISHVTAKPPINGDARYALDLLFYGGIIAEEKGSKKVTAEHVRLVHSSLCPTISSEDIASLPIERLYVLLAVARALKNAETPYVHIKEIEETYKIICEEKGIPKIIDLYEVIDDLAIRELILIRGVTKISIIGVSAEKLLNYIDNIMRRIETAIQQDKRWH